MSNRRTGIASPNMRPLPKPLRASTADVPAATAPPERVMRTCPICRRELSERKCKLYCADPRCGYFLSCADYY